MKTIVRNSVVFMLLLLACGVIPVALERSGNGYSGPISSPVASGETSWPMPPPPPPPPPTLV